ARNPTLDGAASNLGKRAFLTWPMGLHIRQARDGGLAAAYLHAGGWELTVWHLELHHVDDRASALDRWTGIACKAGPCTSASGASSLGPSTSSCSRMRLPSSAVARSKIGGRTP